MNHLFEKFLDHFLSKYAGEQVEFSVDQASEMLKDLSAGLATPTQDDMSDLKILFKRAIKIYKASDERGFLDILEKIHSLLVLFKQEFFVPELLDFATDGDIWNWMESLKGKDITQNDKGLITVLCRELLFLDSLPNLLQNG